MTEWEGRQNGFLDLMSLRREDGYGITISFWRRSADAAEWRADSDHQKIQKKGRDHWYEDYWVRVGKVLRQKKFTTSLLGFDVKNIVWYQPGCYVLTHRRQISRSIERRPVQVSPRPFNHLLMIAAVGLLITACDTRPSESDVEAFAQYKLANDPLEPMNKAIFAVNTTFDKALFRPVVKTYNKVVPEAGRTGLSNFLTNLRAPFVMGNEILQGKPKRAGTMLLRFMTNSTIGIAGLFDPATKMGLTRYDEDLGQTLAVWGIGSGPYIVLPLFGPSNLRDTVGLAGEFYLDPAGIAIDEADVWKNVFLGVDGLSYLRFGLDAFDFRARNDELFDELYETSDPYALARSAYRQLREFEISDGELGETKEEEELFEQDGDPNLR